MNSKRGSINGELLEVRDDRADHREIAVLIERGASDRLDDLRDLIADLIGQSFALAGA